MNSQPAIVIVSGVQGDTRRYRAFHLWQQLRLAGVNCAVNHITSPTVQKLISQVNILILQRVNWDAYLDRLIQKARKNRAVIIADIDDLIFLPEAYQWIDSPDFQDPIRLRLYRENLERNQITLRHCDAILASTDFLAEQAKQLQKPVWVHRNGFSLEMLFIAQNIQQNNQLTGDHVVLGYASGTPTHDKDFAMIQPVLKKLLGEYPHLQLNLAGHLNKDYSWGDAAERVHRTPFVPWRMLPQVLSTFSINLAPLRLDNPFSLSKSEIKYMEAGLLGIPTIASPTQAFQFAINSGNNGYLACDSKDWEQFLRILIENSKLRIEIGQKARDHVLKNYSPWKRASEIVTILNECIQHFNPNINPISGEIFAQTDHNHHFANLVVPISFEKHPTLLERGLYTLRSRGVNTLLEEIWIFFRRMISPVIPFR